MDRLTQHSQEVAPELREQFVEPFIAAATVSLAEWAKTDVVVRDVYRMTFDHSFGDLSAVLRFKSENEECIVLGFTEATAKGLAQRVFEGVIENPDTEMMRDCIGELGNVVSGQAKAMLSGTPYQFSFSTPLVVVGDAPEIAAMRGKECLVIAFGCDLGDFLVQLVLKR